MNGPRALLGAMFRAAVDAAAADRCVPPHLPARPDTLRYGATFRAAREGGGR